MNPKIMCSVLGCTRWTRKYEEGASMICGHCFRLGDPETKARARAEQRAGGPGRTSMEWDTFNELVRQASEARAGIS